MTAFPKSKMTNDQMTILTTARFHNKHQIAHFIGLFGTKLEMVKESGVQKICPNVWLFQRKVVNLHPLLKPCDGELSTENLIYSNTKHKKQ